MKNKKSQQWSRTTDKNAQNIRNTLPDINNNNECIVSKKCAIGVRNKKIEQCNRLEISKQTHTYVIYDLW
jgi:hypothetical protein